MIIKVEKEKPKKIGFNYLVYDTFFPCDGKKECQNSNICGIECKYTKDKEHWLKGTMPIRRMAAPTND